MFGSLGSETNTTSSLSCLFRVKDALLVFHTYTHSLTYHSWWITLQKNQYRCKKQQKGIGNIKHSWKQHNNKWKCLFFPEWICIWNMKYRKISVSFNWKPETQVPYIVLSWWSVVCFVGGRHQIKQCHRQCRSTVLFAFLPLAPHKRISQFFSLVWIRLSEHQPQQHHGWVHHEYFINVVYKRCLWTLFSFKIVFIVCLVFNLTGLELNNATVYKNMNINQYSVPSAPHPSGLTMNSYWICPLSKRREI